MTPPIDEPPPDPLHVAVRRWAQAVNARDRDELVAHSTPDVEVYPLQVGLSGHYEGHGGLRRWIDDMEASGIGHHVRFRGIKTLPDGRVALFGEVCVEGKSISPYALVAVVRDGKIASMHSYLSEEETLEWLGLLG